MHDHDHRHPSGFGYASYQPQHLFLVFDVQGGRGFVKHNDRGLLGQYPGQGHPGPFATGKRADVTASQMSGVGCLQCRIDDGVVVFGLRLVVPGPPTHGNNVPHQKIERHGDVL